MKSVASVPNISSLSPTKVRRQMVLIISDLSGVSCQTEETVMSWLLIQLKLSPTKQCEALRHKDTSQAAAGKSFKFALIETWIYVLPSNNL
jgi:hypothetical protein